MKYEKGEQMMANVIGLDFGNCYSFPCFISEIDLSKGRIGGIVHDLLPNGRNDGIPSVFFYSNKVQLNQNSKLKNSLKTTTT